MLLQDSLLLEAALSERCVSLEVCRSVEVDGGVELGSAMCKYTDQLTMGWLPEERLRLTWLRLDRLLRVRRCNEVYGI